MNELLATVGESFGPFGEKFVGAASPSHDFHLVFFHKTILGNERGVTLGQKNNSARIVVENIGAAGFAFHTFGVGGKTYYLRGFTNLNYA